MPEYDYQRCKFSITCQTDDLGVIHCLRALCEHAEKDGKPQIGWGGTKRTDWLAAGKKITLRFTRPEFRETFAKEAIRLLPPGSWTEESRSDEDPATRQRPLR